VYLCRHTSHVCLLIGLYGRYYISVSVVIRAVAILSVGKLACVYRSQGLNNMFKYNSCLKINAMINIYNIAELVRASFKYLEYNKDTSDSKTNFEITMGQR